MAKSKQQPRLTAEENRCLVKLSEAWNIFQALDGKCSGDNDEFARAVHQAQALVGLRVARRADPKVWTQPRKE